MSNEDQKCQHQEDWPKLKRLRIKKLKIYVNTENQKDGFEKKIKIIMIQRV